MSTKRFLGYDTDEKGKLVINREQAEIVERIYEEYLSGMTAEHIKRIFEKEGVKNWEGQAKWEASTIKSILKNEKYKGDAILQKTYTVDFLSKKRAKNKGNIQQYHIEENHNAIIDPLIWEAVQLENLRREEYIKKYGLTAYATKPETNPFAGKIICGHCNKPYIRKTWKSGGDLRKVWQCQERYKLKGVEGCSNRNVDESILQEAFILSWKSLQENKENLKRRQETIAEFGNPLEQYRAIQFADQTERQVLLDDIQIDFILRILDNIKIYENGRLVIKFMECTEIEFEGE